MRTEVQNRLTELIQNGTFAKITYGKTDKLATVSTTEFIKPAVVVNEISGTTTNSVSAGARSGTTGMSGWQFEARIKFPCEVDLDYFLRNELKTVSFVHDNTLVRAVSTGYPVAHPPRQGTHNGTEAVMTFSVTTRR